MVPSDRTSVHRRHWWRLVELRTIWFPTLSGWLFIGLLIIIPNAWWFLYGESYLSSTGGSLPAEILVVESWIGYPGIRAAATEFSQHAYQYVVTTGGLTNERWADRRWSYSESAARELVKSGVPVEKIIVASARETARQRTYESAVAVSQALQERNIRPHAIRVFTLGPHARRSSLVFSKVLGAGTKVAAIGWALPHDQDQVWWRSSERAKEFLSETAGYAYELLLNSGRNSHIASAGAAAANESVLPIRNSGANSVILVCDQLSRRYSSRPD